MVCNMPFFVVKYELRNNMTRQELLSRICNASFNGCLGLFVGAGFTKAALKGSFDYEVYSWKELLRECCKEMDVDESIVDTPLSNPEIASNICNAFVNKNPATINYEKSVERLKKIIADKVSVFPEEKVKEKYVDYFKSINLSWVITTNYDTIIESFLEDKAIPIGPEDFFLKREGFVPVYHIHGIRFSPQSIVITNEDYAKYFRPNDYRSARLPFLIKESLVLMIGYGLGDLNVLTAVDLAKNVYSDNGESFPIIQLVYKGENFKNEPYQHPSGIWIIEIQDIPSFFDELIAAKASAEEIRKKTAETIEANNHIFDEPNDATIDAFIDQEMYRNQIIDIVKSLDREYNSVYLHFELFCRNVFKKCRIREAPSGAFDAHKLHLKVLIDLLKIPFKKMPISFFSFLASELDDLAYYIGDGSGQSWAADETWKNEASSIPEDMLYQIKQYNAGKGRYYTHLAKILGKIK